MPGQIPSLAQKILRRIAKIPILIAWLIALPILLLAELRPYRWRRHP